MSRREGFAISRHYITHQGSSQDLIPTFYSPDKLDPNSKAFEKLKNAKKFDPKRSSVLEVLNEQLKKNSDVDSENENDTGRKI